MKKRVKFNKYYLLLILVLGVFVVYAVSNLNISLTGKVVSENEATSTTTKTTTYVYAGGLVASYDSDGKEKYYINDHLGGTGVVIDKTGNVVGSEEYYAFGEEKLSTGNEKFTYTGKELDDSGFYYYGARYYDAGTGRFISPDPLLGGIENPASLNRYVYVLNNPLKYTDPSGMANEPKPDATNVVNWKSAKPDWTKRRAQTGENAKLSLPGWDESRLINSQAGFNLFRAMTLGNEMLYSLAPATAGAGSPLSKGMARQMDFNYEASSTYLPSNIIIREGVKLEGENVNKVLKAGEIARETEAIVNNNCEPNCAAGALLNNVNTKLGDISFIMTGRLPNDAEGHAWNVIMVKPTLWIEQGGGGMVEVIGQGGGGNTKIYPLNQRTYYDPVTFARIHREVLSAAGKSIGKRR